MFKIFTTVNEITPKNAHMLFHMETEGDFKQP